MKVKQLLGIPFIAAAIQVDKKDFDTCEVGDYVSFKNGAAGLITTKQEGKHIHVDNTENKVYTLLIIENGPTIGPFLGESLLAQSLGQNGIGEEFTISKPNK